MQIFILITKWSSTYYNFYLHYYTTELSCIIKIFTQIVDCWFETNLLSKDKQMILKIHACYDDKNPLISQRDVFNKFECMLFAPSNDTVH